MSADPPDVPRRRFLLPGTRLGRFTIRGLLGRGPASTLIHVDIDNKGTDLPRAATLKLYDDRKARRREESFLSRFADLRIPKVLALGSSRYGRYELVDQLEGVTLSHLISAHGAFSAQEATHVVADVARAVLSAHDRGLTHPGVRPENVMFERTGEAYIGGLQVSGHLPPLGNDVYALGSMLCLTATGRLPHELAGLAYASAGAISQWYDNGGFHADTQAINSLRYLAQDDQIVDIVMGAMHPDELMRTAAFDLVEQLSQHDKELRAKTGLGPVHDSGRHRGEESPVLKPAGYVGRHAGGEGAADTTVLPAFGL